MGNSSDKAIRLKLKAFAISLFTITFPIMGTTSFYMSLGEHSMIQWISLIVILMACLMWQALMLSDAIEGYDLKYPNGD